MSNDKRLIEDYLPIVAISAEASREKNVRKGHISTFSSYQVGRHPEEGGDERRKPRSDNEFARHH
jgi:hypothetical protein